MQSTIIAVVAIVCVLAVGTPTSAVVPVVSEHGGDSTCLARDSLTLVVLNEDTAATCESCTDGSCPGHAFGCASDGTATIYVNTDGCEVSSGWTAVKPVAEGVCLDVAAEIALALGLAPPAGDEDYGVGSQRYKTLKCMAEAPDPFVVAPGGLLIRFWAAGSAVSDAVCLDATAPSDALVFAQPDACIEVEDNLFARARCDDNGSGVVICSDATCSSCANPDPLPDDAFLYRPRDGCDADEDGGSIAFGCAVRIAGAKKKELQAAPDHVEPTSQSSLAVYWVVAMCVGMATATVYKRRHASGFRTQYGDRIREVTVVSKVLVESSVVGVLVHEAGDPYGTIPRLLGLVLSVVVQAASVGVFLALNLDDLEDQGGSLENFAVSFVLSFLVGAVVSTLLGVQFFRTAIQDGPFRGSDASCLTRSTAIIIGCTVSLFASAAAALAFTVGPDVLGSGQEVAVVTIVSTLSATWVSTYLIFEPVFTVLKYYFWLESFVWSVEWLRTAGGSSAGIALAKRNKVGPAPLAPTPADATALPAHQPTHQPTQPTYQPTQPTHQPTQTSLFG